MLLRKFVPIPIVAASLVSTPALGQATFSRPGLIYSARAAGGPIAVDRNGHVFAVESEPSADDATTTPSMFVTEFARDARVVVKRVNIGHGVASAIALDSSGNVFVAGSTLRQEFPATTAFLVGDSGMAAFVVKLNAAGALVYSVVAGGAYAEASGVAVDDRGDAYLTGVASGGDFPTTEGAFDRVFQGGGDPTEPSDIFVLKLNGTGTALLYSTYLGGSGDDRPAGIGVDFGGNAYVAGTTLS